MKEQFVTYEIALKLKELGFDEKCFGYYRPMKEWMMEGTKFNFERHFHGCNWANPNNTMYFMYVQNSFGDREASVKNSEFTKAIENIAVPLWQQVIDWLREKHDIELSIVYFRKEFRIRNKILKYIASIYDTKNELENESDEYWEENKPIEIESNDCYYVREQAILKAIELCKK